MMCLCLYISAGTKKAAKLKCAQNGLASVEAGEIKPSKVSVNKYLLAVTTLQYYV